MSSIILTLRSLIPSTDPVNKSVSISRPHILILLAISALALDLKKFRTILHFASSCFNSESLCSSEIVIAVSTSSLLVPRSSSPSVPEIQQVSPSVPDPDSTPTPIYVC
eukprot:746660-Hanusia_phi.AAC.2